jgi:predicted nucleotidyltransferase
VKRKKSDNKRTEFTGFAELTYERRKEERGFIKGRVSFLLIMRNLDIL